MCLITAIIKISVLRGTRPRTDNSALKSNKYQTESRSQEYHFFLLLRANISINSRIYSFNLKRQILEDTISFLFSRNSKPEDAFTHIFTGF